MLNKVILTGRITADIELRKTNSDIPYTYFTLAVNRPSNNDQTDFISCVAWRGTAELMNNYLKKGSLIAVEGRLEVYRTQSEGSYETRTNVNVQSITFLETRTQSYSRESDNPEPTNSDAMRDIERSIEPRENEKNEESSNEKTKSDFEIDFDSIKF